MNWFSRIVTSIAVSVVLASSAVAQNGSKVVFAAAANGQTGAMQTGARASGVTFTFCGTGFSGNLYVDAAATSSALAQVWTTTLAANSDCTTTYAYSPASKWYRVRWTRSAGTLDVWMSIRQGESTPGGLTGPTGGLTAGRVALSGSATQVTDDAGLQYDPTTDTLKVASLTQGQVVRAGADGALVSDNDLVYTVATKSLDVTDGRVQAANLKATPLPASGSVTVTPVLSQIGAITVVAGSALADGDGLSVGDGTGIVPIEFDSAPGDGTTGGAVPIIFDGTETATQIRDAVKAILDASGRDWTTSNQGADGIGLVRATPGATGGAITESVTDAGFTVTDWTDPTHATTYTYSLQACLADGTCNAAGPASSTAAGVATLSAAQLNRLAWSAVPGAASYKIRRDVGGATTGAIWSGTALTVDDTGLAGDGSAKPTDNTTGTVTADNYGTLVKAKNVTVDGGALTLTPVAAPGAPTLTATVAGTKPAGTWNGKATWVTATGETALGTVSANITVDGSKAITVTRPSDPPPLATGWRWYSSKQGPTATWWVTSGTIPIATLTYDDNTADAALVVDATGNTSTAGRRLYVGNGPTLTDGTYAIALGYSGPTTLPLYSVCMGPYAGQSLTTGRGNSIFGYYAGNKTTTGENSSLFGFQAGQELSSGAWNTAAGYHAGFNSGATPSTANALTTGSYNTFVGSRAGLGSSTQRNNSTALGYGAYVNASDRVVLGNGAVADVWAGSTGQARLVGTGIRLVTGTRPTCDATTRGLIFYVAGGAGVADTCEVCRKDNADAYAWVSLY